MVVPDHTRQRFEKREAPPIPVVSMETQQQARLWMAAAFMTLPLAAANRYCSLDDCAWL